MQGKYFDAPARLFFSVKNASKNTFTQKSDNREYIPELYYLPDLFMNRNEFFFGFKEKELISNCYINSSKEDYYKKYEFLANIKNELEFNNLNINKWIDLFFGVNQQSGKYEINGHIKNVNYYPEHMKRDYFQKNNIKSVDIIDFMKLDFGMLPYQIYNEESKSIKNKSNELCNNIKDFNEKQFSLEHKFLNNNELIDDSFECSGSDNINYGYYYIIVNKKYNKEEYGKSLSFATLKEFQSKNSDTKNTFFKFVGNNLGDIKIEIKDKINNKDKKTEEEKVRIVKLRDHTKAIKYIDYNKRLNMFLSYSLDGYINIYCFPSCKYVRSIKVSEFTEEELKVVVLVSNPFPMIFTCDNIFMYVISINGELIKKNPIPSGFESREAEIKPIIDKDFGIVNDYICFSLTSLKTNVTTTKRIEIKLPSLDLFNIDTD